MKPKELIRAKEFFREGDFNAALELVNSFEENEGIFPKGLLSSHLIKSLLLIKLGRCEEGTKVAEIAYQESQELGKFIQSIDASILMSRALWRLMRLDDALEVIVQAENLLRSLTQEPATKLRHREASISTIKGYIYFYKGDMERAFVNVERGLALREKLGDKIELMEPLMQMGYYYTLVKGDLERGLMYGEHCQTIANEINNKSMRDIVARNLMNLGNIYNIKGEIERALMYYERCLATFEELNEKFNIPSVLNGIALIYWEQGEVNRGLVFLEQALALYEELGDNLGTSFNLSNLIEFSLNKGEIERARKYLERLDQLNDQEENELINLSYHLCKALILKTSPRARNRVKAEETFKRIVEEKIIHYEITVDALLNLCELFLIELRNTGDLEILDEIQLYITHLLDLAEKNNSYSLLSETHLLQARLELLTFNIKNARRFLTQAQQIAERHKLNRLAQRISEEHEDLLKKMSVWEELKKSDASLTKRMELARFGKQLGDMLQKRGRLTTQITEEKVTIHKEKKICVVCKGEVLGFTYICKCDAIYCENCARALTNLENECWACNAPIDASKPVKPYMKDKEKIEIKNSRKPQGKTTKKGNNSSSE